MGKSVLKNWSPREVVRFLKKNGFVDVKGKGDHCCLFNDETKAYTEVDMGRDAFTQREMLGFVEQTKISKELWKKGKKVQFGKGKDIFGDAMQYQKKIRKEWN